MANKLSPYKTYLIFSIFSALFFSMVFTVSMVYQIEIVKLSPLQLILVGTTLETTCFLFEIPTGIVADIYSRKLSVIIGVILIGLGFMLEGFISTLTSVLIAQVLWGIGYTFISGALDAWIAEEDKSIPLDEIYIKGSQVSQIGSVIGIILATIVGNFSLRLPIVIGGTLFLVLSAFLFLYMPEHNFNPSAPENLNTFKKMSHTLFSSMKVIKSNKIIILILSITLFYGLSSEGYDRLYTAHFLKDTTLPTLGNLQPVTWFGIFGIIGMLLSAIVIQLVIKKFHSSENTSKFKNIGLLLAINIFFILSMIIFAITRDFKLMLIGYLSTNTFRTVNEPIFNGWLNNNIEANSRATVLSTNGQINALGQILGGPLIGIIATNFSISVGILSTALLLVPVLILYSLCLFRNTASSIVIEEKPKL
ncbi:DHA3 family tetracycline resistance protein-like MFS transporter [Clostridium punense]|uniref:DHA3 family tetracycline resistance protein-like MFS transporter n=1 Tax=Clostridium punense TaxID=1054297 RepID=A0ABS4JZD9_9CLOT|nr:MFS transporter [Clostridium punense]MBP2020900.1 DHA3 family tetracycline resistance protein-like MFS transporter [Clostridium punense]